MKTKEEDKYKKQGGREAFHSEEESEFLNEEDLDTDLTDVDLSPSDEPGIVNSKNPEGQEWNAREDQNR